MMGGALALVTVSLRLLSLNLSYKIHRVEVEIGKAQSDLERVRVKVTQHQSPGYLNTLSETKYGLREPKPEQVVRIHE